MALYYSPGSPGVSFTEAELNQIVVNQSVSIGAIVGEFEWGPAEEVELISSEGQLRNIHGDPNDHNYKHWFSASNFLQYSQQLRLIRAISDESLNAAQFAADATLIKSASHFQTKYSEFLMPGKQSAVYARYPGEFGNKIRVVMADKATIDANPSHILRPHIMQLLNDNSVVIGVFVGEELKEFGVYSTDSKARMYNGATNYIIAAINTQSDYILLVEQKFMNLTHQVMTDPGTGGDPGDPGYIPPTYVTVPTPIDIDTTLSGGYNAPVSVGDFMRAWDMFSDPDTSDVSLLMQGGCPQEVGVYIASVITDMRKDSIALVSPQLDNVTNLNPQTILNNLIIASNALGFSKYRFMDGNYKLQYDRYNDVTRWVPLNGDIAGIFAEVDEENAPWFSPGGRIIKNTLQLAFYPTKAQRDDMYKYRINPVTSFNGTGSILYGDWTGASLEEASNFVNVRRLLNYLEKSISIYARVLLWQLNDGITAAAFQMTVEPFLRQVAAGRGMQRWQLICDSTVNSIETMSAGKFIAIIRILPTFSIRWVELKFETTRTDAVFSEG